MKLCVNIDLDIYMIRDKIRAPARRILLIFSLFKLNLHGCNSYLAKENFVTKLIKGDQFDTDVSFLYSITFSSDMRSLWLNSSLRGLDNVRGQNILPGQMFTSVY